MPVGKLDESVRRGQPRGDPVEGFGSLARGRRARRTDIDEQVEGESFGFVRSEAVARRDVETNDRLACVGVVEERGCGVVVETLLVRCTMGSRRGA